MELVGDRNIFECQSIYKSIDIRAMMITYQVLGMVKSNKEENQGHVDKLKETVSLRLKVIKSITKKISEIETNIYGISDKEIKQNQKYSKGRKPDPELLAKVKLYLIDPAKYVKDDKTVKPAKLRWNKKKEAGNKQNKN